MSLHSTFKVGGNADLFIVPNSAEALVKAISVLKSHMQPYFIIGNGSNLVVSDTGVRAAVISTCGIKGIEKCGANSVTAYAGESLAAVAAFCAANSLTGMEFASGIPGTFGGAVYMNAGAYDGEMCGIVKTVTVTDENGNIRELDNSGLKFGYRSSLLQNEKSVMLRGTIELCPGDKSAIKAKMLDFNSRRAEKQPLDFPSAGSTFKRPDGYFAGKLIMDTGLSGFSVGGAQVSPKHCGFIVNTGGATAHDILTLINTVREKVSDKFGVVLEPEVRLLGDF